MKLFFATILIIPTSISASRSNNFQPRTAAFSLPVDIVSSAKDELLSFSKQQFAESKSGVFLSDYESKQKLKKLTAELEAVCDAPTEASQDFMLGDWKLLCTIATPTDDISSRLPPKSKKKKEMKKGPFGLPLPSPPEFLTSTLDPIQDNLRQSVEVIQRIRNVEGFDGDSDTDVLNRVDNVIQFTPFSMENILNGANFNLNPLEVTKSKISLVHSAKVQSVSPLLRTKLVLKSYVLTVAGTSQYLEPDGADILGLNVPLGDLFNFGSFDTTYVDEEIRISRSKVGLVEQLRVFVRMTSEDEGNDIDESESVENFEREMGDAEITMDKAEDTSEAEAKEEETAMDEEETETSEESEEEEEKVTEEEKEEEEEEAGVENPEEEIDEEAAEEVQDEDSNDETDSV